MHLSAKCLFLLLSLFSLLALTCASTRPTNAVSYKRVTRSSDLWRYQVGGGSKSLNIGDDYYCLLSNRMKFMASRGGKVYNDRTWCQTEERFEIKFISGGLATLKRYLSDDYVSCWNNGEARLSKQVGEWQKFKLEIDPSGDRLTFYNPNRDRHLRAKSDGSIRCDSKTNQETAAQFLGWKTGKKEEWKPYDEGRLVKSFDNSGRPKSRTFEYTRTVGVKQVKGTAAGSRADDPVRGGSELKNIFVTQFNSPTMTKWEDQKALVWGDAEEETGKVEVPAMSTMRVYQIVGTYGPLEIYSEEFLEADFPSAPQSETKTEIVAT